MKKGKLRVLAGMMCVVLAWMEILSVGIKVSAAEKGSAVMTEVEIQDAESMEGTVEEMEKWESENSTEKEGEKQDEEEIGKTEEDKEQDGTETMERDSIAEETEDLETEQATEKTDSNMDKELLENEMRTESVEKRLESMTSADDIASGTYGDVVWVIDKNGKLIVEGTGDFAGEFPINGGYRYQRAPWYAYRASIISVEANVIEMSNAEAMFFDCKNLIKLNLDNFDTSQVTDMWGMFSGCSSLISLDLSNFDTSQVTDMWDMFSGCSSLISLDLSR